MKVIVFGAGKLANRFLSRPLRKNIEILFVCDNSEDKQGKFIGQYKIHSPEDIVGGLKYDKLVVLVGFGYLEEILSQLDMLGVDLEKVILPLGCDFIDYCECPLDEIFITTKKQPVKQFSYSPVTISHQYFGETWKSHDRREKEGFFDKYCQGLGLDIGYAGDKGGGDLIVPTCCGWDIDNGDAQYLDGVKDESFDFVYSSHCLEHVNNVRTALKNWFRVLKNGGYLIIAVPDRDLYEKRKRLPSRWNGDHKHMFLIGKREKPHTLDIVEEVREALSGNIYSICYVKRCDARHTISDPLIHSDGEYQIEMVIQKS